MCGAHSALGLQDVEREVWLDLRERLRVPGQMMALMRGVLGGDTEVAVAAAVTPQGLTQPVALLLGPELAALVRVSAAPSDPRPGRLGEYDVDVLTAGGEGDRPVALLVSPWVREHLTVYARKLWTDRWHLAH